MHENRRRHRDLGAIGIRSLIPHLKILATSPLAHLYHQVVIALRQCHAFTGLLSLAVAAVVVDDLLAVQVQERAVIGGGVEPVSALCPGCEKTAAPDAEVVGLPDVREAAMVHVDVRQNLCMSRGQSSEVRDMALSLVVEVLALQTGFKGLGLMFENRRRHRDLGAIGIRSLIPHLKILATSPLAHLYHQVVIALRQCHAFTGLLGLAVAAVVVDDLLAVQVQERAVIGGGVEPVSALCPGCEKTAAPDAEVVGLPDVREAAMVHVDVRQNLCMSRGQSSEVRDMALSLVVEVLALQTGFKGLGLMFENRRRHRDRGAIGIRSLIPHLKILATTRLAHVDQEVMETGQKGHVMARPLLFRMAAVVVDDLLAVQVQERAVIGGGVEPVIARVRYAHIAAAPDAEVVGLPDVREAAMVHVDVRQNLCMSRGQSSEVRDMALSLVVEVVALQTLSQRWLECHDVGIDVIWHDTAIHNRTTEGGPI